MHLTYLDDTTTYQQGYLLLPTLTYLQLPPSKDIFIYHKMPSCQSATHYIIIQHYEWAYLEYDTYTGLVSNSVCSGCSSLLGPYDLLLILYSNSHLSFTSLGFI